MDTLKRSLLNSNFNVSVTEVLMVLLVSLVSGVYIYAYFKNRNKNYPPGPVGIPILGYLPFLGAEPHKTLWKLKEKYGNIIGLYFGRQYTIILNDWTAVKEVLAHTSALDRAENFFDLIPTTGFGTANGKKWIEQRRFCMATSKDLGVGRGPWENTILDEVQSFIQELLQSNGRPIDIANQLNYSVSSNIVSFLIGRKLHKEDEKDKVQLSVEFSDVTLTYTSPTHVISFMPWLRKYFEMFKIAGYDRAAKVIKGFCQFMKDEISRHKTSPELKDAYDFINSYLRKLTELKSASNHYFSETMLEGNVNVLFLGGSDTIFTSLVWIFRLMAQHQDIQQKVYNELMSVLGKDGIARYEERDKIPYTFAVMMEGQRFSSIVPISTTRRANQDFSVRGYTIPKGTDIVGNLWALHHDPQYWDEPEKFKPERFLQDEGRVLIKAPPSYAPFSTGRRNCPGETIAWMEILFYFSEIIKKFEISTESGKKPEFDIVHGLVERLKPQPLCFKERT